MSDQPQSSQVQPIGGKLRWLWLLPVILIMTLMGGALWLDSASGHRFIEKQINQIITKSGLGFYIEGIEGSIYSDMRVKKLILSDLSDEFFTANNIEMQWFPLSYISGRLSIDTLAIESGRFDKIPVFKESDEGPKLPDFDIFIGSLEAQSIIINPQILGRADTMSLTGNADIQSGRARIEMLLSSDSGNDIAYIDVDIDPDHDKFKLAADIEAPDKGFIQNLTKIKWADKIVIAGRGSWTQWNGTLDASLGEVQQIDLALKANAGQYKAVGDLSAATLPPGLIEKISTPILAIDIDAQYDNKMLRFNGDANSDNIELQMDGGFDFSMGGPDALLIDFNVLKPESIAKNLSGDSVAGRLRIDGPISNMKLEYLVTADAIGLGPVQLTGVSAAGDGRRINKALELPIEMSASGAIGLDPQILELMRDIEAQGFINVDNNILTLTDIAVKSNRITGILSGDTDFLSRQYDFKLDGKLPSYLFEGIGPTDLEAILNFRPAQPLGLQITGDVRAIVRRMDNGFLAELGGGLPIVDAKISLGPDGIFRFPSFKVTAPLLSFEGSGRRLKDRSYLISGDGAHERYGQANVEISGDLARPMISLLLDRPLDSLGLRDVRVTLSPQENGFAFNSEGQSLLGPFSADGDLLLPVGEAFIARFDRLLVSDTIVTGRVTNSASGLIGDFAVNQGGVEGMITMRATDNMQRVDANLTIANARFRGDDNILIRSGKFTMTGLFNGQNSDVDATLQAQGISRGNLILGRVAANAKIKNGTGNITASLAGTRGSGFDLTSNINVQPNKYSIRASGNFRRKPIRLTRDAIISKSDGVWTLQPSRMSYGGGQLTASGRYGPQLFELDALMNKLPLNLLDLGDSNLGFGGVASGNIQYSNLGIPRGEAKLNIKGLTRSGLLLSSEPIDAALNMKLANSTLAARAILSNDDKNIGRFQTKVNLANGSDIIERIKNGNLFAQGRFDGRADTLWRLTGIELFDLTGDVKIAADARGSLNNPKIKGALQTKNARLSSNISGTIINQLQTKGRFDGSRLRILEMSGNTQGGGSISGRGYFDFTNSNAIGINLDILAKNALLINRDDVAARVTGPIKFLSSGIGGTVSGDLVMNEGRYQLGQANAAEILPNINVREINRRNDLPFANRNVAPWRLDLDVKSNNRFDVNGLGIESEWSGDFKIGGRIDSPTIGGRADLVRGDYDFAGRVFSLSRGAMIFDRRSPPNPQIDIVAEALLNGVDARIEVRGRSLAPSVTFASTPALPQEELLARLLFGSSVLELSAPEAIQLSSALIGLQSGGGLDPVNVIRKAVGLDRLRIVSANAATGQGTGIAVGKYIGRRTFVELITDGRGYSATQAEFQVTRWLSILSTISTIGEQGVNVKVSRDY